MTWLTESEFLQEAKQRQREEWDERLEQECGEWAARFDPLTKRYSHFQIRCEKCEKCIARQINELAQRINIADYVYHSETAKERTNLNRRLGPAEEYVCYPSSWGFFTFSNIKKDGAITREQFMSLYDGDELFDDFLFGNHGKYRRSGFLGEERVENEKLENPIKINYKQRLYRERRHYLEAMAYANEKTYDLLPNARTLQDAIHEVERRFDEYIEAREYPVFTLRTVEKKVDGNKIDWSVGRDTIPRLETSHKDIVDHNSNVPSSMSLFDVDGERRNVQQENWGITFGSGRA